MVTGKSDKMDGLRISVIPHGIQRIRTLIIGVSDHLSVWISLSEFSVSVVVG